MSHPSYTSAPFHGASVPVGSCILLLHWKELLARSPWELSGMEFSVSLSHTYPNPSEWMFSWPGLWCDFFYRPNSLISQMAERSLCQPSLHLSSLWTHSSGSHLQFPLDFSRTFICSNEHICRTVLINNIDSFSSHAVQKILDTAKDSWGLKIPQKRIVMYGDTKQLLIFLILNGLKLWTRRNFFFLRC